jgi:hypothetical protein
LWKREKKKKERWKERFDISHKKKQDKQVSICIFVYYAKWTIKYWNDFWNIAKEILEGYVYTWVWLQKISELDVIRKAQM